MTRPMFIVVASVADVDAERLIETRGQTARALLALVAAGPRGRTALEVSSWALRFAAYCYELRHECGLTIITERESHVGGWHGRHVLLSSVRILSVQGESEAA
jgi:hypothetical protein